MSIDPKAVAGYVTDHPTATGLGLVAALIVLVLVWWAGRGITHAVQRGLSGKRPEDVITFIYSAMATTVAAEGMLNFFGAWLDMPIWMQSLTFGMFELGMLGCALRGRRKIRDPEIGTAGIDGVLVWVMAGISGLLASTAAHGWGIFARLIIPLFAAGGWELLLAYERRRAGRSTISWRWTPEKILVRFGLAEASDRTAGETDTHRRLVRVARAAKHLRDLKAAGASEKQIRRATRRLDVMNDAAADQAGLADDPAVQEKLRSLVAVMFNATSLAEMTPDSPWEDRPDPMVKVFDTARIQFAPLIAGAISTGTEKSAELGTGTGTEEPSDEPADTGTGDPSDTGTESDATLPRRTGTPRRRSTGTKKRAKPDWEALVAQARKINNAHVNDHGRPISGDKLAAELRVSKTKALDVLAEAKRPRAVPSDGVA